MRSRCLALLAVTLGAASAAADPVHVPYRATLGGLEIATGALTIEAAGAHYRLSLDGVLAGAKVARARAHAAGRLVRSGLMPDLYSADFDHVGQKSRVALAFANGALAMVAVLPPGAKGSGQTRPPQSQAYGLIDPLSALAIPAAAAHLAPLSACGRTQRVFDGVRRYELTLFPSRSEIVTVASAPIGAIVCRAELRTGAVSTQRRSPARVERWQEGRGSQRALVWLAPIAGGRLLAPLRIEASLGYGTLTVEATDAQAFNAALFASVR
jgi:hypothetical protein